MPTSPSPTTPDELTAPLDLLLTAGTRGVATRMLPGSAWSRLGISLAGRPRTVTRRGGNLVRELGTIAAGSSDRAPETNDKRFGDAAWHHNPALRRAMQAYLAVSHTADALLTDADLDWRDHERMRFVLDNLVEGLSPTNNPFLSPLGWKAMVDTGGLSAARGVRAFVRDMLSSPRVPAVVEPDAFAVGENVAATKGAVVARTRTFELIHYAPQTETVHATPLLIVPPVINKYYILDIAPGRSLIEYLLQQGQQVFAISWRNPHARHRDWDADTYGAAIVEALDAVQGIAGTACAHLLGTCSGGILAAMTAAHLADIGEGDRVAGLTLAVTVLDQTRAGTASAVLSERTAAAAIRASAAKGFLDGRTLAEMFAWLRPTDLVWRYWVNNYVQGRPPAAFDVLFWNSDTTRMAAALHRDLVLLGLRNSLTTPGAATMLGTPVDLGRVTADAYVVGGSADHLCPWRSTYRSAQLLGSKDARFVLSSNGHIAALVNPPGNPRASYRFGEPAAESPDGWSATAESAAGSWWTDYSHWLAARSGPDVDAPHHLGARQFPPLAPAPGTYVHHS